MKVFVALAALAFSLTLSAQEVIALPEPDKNVSVTLTEALQNRHSERTFSSQGISDGTLSLVLWAAAGVNRADGRLTVPSAMNAQDINVYVLRADGAFRYDAKANTLTRVSGKDLRSAVAGPQGSVAQAPVILVMTSDTGKLRIGAEAIPYLDAGYVSQDICLICSALGLNTVPRMGMDKDVLTRELGLKAGEIPIINNPIGYPAK